MEELGQGYIMEELGQGYIIYAGAPLMCCHPGLHHICAPLMCCHVAYLTPLGRGLSNSEKMYSQHCAVIVMKTVCETKPDFVDRFPSTTLRSFAAIPMHAWLVSPSHAP